MFRIRWPVLSLGFPMSVGPDVKFIWTVVTQALWVLRQLEAKSHYITDITIPKSYLMVWLGSGQWCFAVRHKVFCPSFLREPKELMSYLELSSLWSLPFSTWRIGFITCSPKARVPNQKCRPPTPLLHPATSWTVKPIQANSPCRAKQTNLLCTPITGNSRKEFLF